MFTYLSVYTEYNEALEWVKTDLDFDIYQDVNCFETTIRALGGLLSAYHLSQDKILLEKANDLGDRLIHCFDSPSHTVPFSDVNLKTKAPKAPKWSTDSSLSEVSSMQLEFRDLAYELQNHIYEVYTSAIVYLPINIDNILNRINRSQHPSTFTNL